MIRVYGGDEGWSNYTVYVDNVKEKAIVSIQPKPAFPSMLDVSVTLKGSSVVVVC